MGKRIAITGATGSLGSAVAHALLERGDEVVALSRKPDTVRRRMNAPVEAFAYSPQGLQEALAAGPVHAVVHTACVYGRDGESLVDLIEANVTQPLRLVLASADIERWINVGTALPPEVSAYALSKRQFADWLEHLPGDHAVPDRTTIALQAFYGTVHDASSLLARVARACLKSETVKLTPGTQRRDFIYMHDAVRGILAILDREAQHGHRVVELGTGIAHSIREVTTMIRDLAGTGVLEFGAVASRPGEPATCVADTGSLTALGWSAEVNLENGLPELVQMQRERLASEIGE